MEKKQYIMPQIEVTQLESDVIMVVGNPTSSGSQPPHPVTGRRWTDVF